MTRFGQRERLLRTGEQLLAPLTFMAALLSLLTGCTPLKQYRTNYPPYPSGQAELAAQTNTIETGSNYILGIIEFDDHGWLWSSNQMKAVIDRVSEEDTNNGLLIVVFAHGWKHNASWDDANVQAFRGVLGELAALEQTYSAQHTDADDKL